jgi:molecular chaperone DnaK (HSP70)
MKKRPWAFDIGTTNTGVSFWDEEAGQPQLLELPAISRAPERSDPLEAPRMIPSAVHLLEDPGLIGRIGKWPIIRSRLFLGRTALIGRPALERNRTRVQPAFVPTFKRSLEGEALRPLVRIGRRTFSARQVARAFLRELLAEITRATGHRPRELVLTSPVGSFETYRAELSTIARQLGVRRVRFLDEPVAAALGYGLTFTQERDVLVVDIGGGTMHLALVRISPGGARAGRAQIIGKQGRPLGGNAVDGWVLTQLCADLRYPLDELRDDEEIVHWRRLMLAEACRAKEAVFFKESVLLKLVPPGLSYAPDGRLPGSPLVTFTKERLAGILREQGFYRALEECHAGLFGPAAGTGFTEADVEDVLLVGGSTLLPGVFPLFEERFGRAKIRAWQPFEAVAYGAASYAADRFTQLDSIVHDYAFLTHDPKTGEAQHTVVVPRGTRFPTPPDLWKRHVVPACSLGEPETFFKLVVCEIGQGEGPERRFVWDAAGGLHKVGGAEDQGNKVIVPLNEANPTLGFLDPPHQPGDRRPRLEVAFGVNEERWLVATVRDLRTQKLLMQAQPVVRLL